MFENTNPKRSAAIVAFRRCVEGKLLMCLRSVPLVVFKFSPRIVDGAKLVKLLDSKVSQGYGIKDWISDCNPSKT